MAGKLSKEARDELVADENPLGLVDATLNGAGLNPDEMIAELASRPGAQEVVGNADIEAEGSEEPGAQAPEAEAEIEVQAEGGEESPEEGEESEEPGSRAPKRAPEPDWIKQLPPELQANARKLHETAEGQRFALKRRGDQVRAAEIERRQAIEIAVQLRKQMQSGTQAEAEKTVEAEVEEYLEGEIDAQGNARIPVKKLRELIAAEAKRLNEGEQQQQRQQTEGQRYALELLSEAGVEDATTQRLSEATMFLRKELVRVAREIGRPPTSPLEERQMLREAGVDRTLAAKYGGLKILDVYQVLDGVNNPHQHGDRLVEIAQGYQQSWAKPAKPKLPEKPRIGEHPVSMARKGAALPAKRVPGERASEDLANMSMDDAIKAVRDPNYLAKKFGAWEEELRSEGHIR